LLLSRQPLLFAFTSKEAADGAAAKHQVSRPQHPNRKKTNKKTATAGTKLGPDRESRQAEAHMHAPSLALHGPRPAGRQEPKGEFQV